MYQNTTSRLEKILRLCEKNEILLLKQQKALEKIEGQIGTIPQLSQSIADLSTLLGAIKTELDGVADAVEHQFRTLTIVAYNEKGEQVTMPFQLTDGGTGSHVFLTAAETDAAGNPVTIDPTKITWGVSDPSALTVTANPTASPVDSPDVPGQQIAPGGAEVAAVAAAGHLGAFQVTSQDTGNNLQAQDTITVVSGAATSLVMSGTVV